MITVEIKEMPTRDRIILMEEIWDTLCDDDNKMESPVWHEDVLDERRTKIINGKANFISIDVLKTGKMCRDFRSISRKP